MQAPRWSPKKSLWLAAHALPWALWGPSTLSASSLAVFVVSSAITLCCGHSVGMHRGLIHRAYRAKRPVRVALAWLGCLVGMGGPLSLLALHDLRDHAQNLPACPTWLRHGEGPLVDGWQQLHCAPPPLAGHAPRRDLEWEADLALRWLERWWRWQNLPVALLLFALGGWSWVVWGVFARVVVSLHGHWLVGWFAHNRGAQPHALPGVAIAGYNSLLFGALSFGEGWHNNHHAYPWSARMGLAWYELDLGWWFIRAMRGLGLVEEVRAAPSR